MEMESKPTIKDVARVSGVSISTVSNVINNRSSVSEKTRKKVLEAIRRLNYKPNKFAQGLSRKKKSGSNFVTVIGLSVPHYFTQGVKALSVAVKHRAREVGVQVIEYLSENDCEKQIFQVSEMIRRRVDGVICFPVDYRRIEKAVQECHLVGIPFVSLNRFSYGDVYAVVKSDDYKAGNDLGLYVAFRLKDKKGKILEMETEENDFNSFQRSRGFNDVIENWPGLEVIERCCCGRSAEQAEKVALEALKKFPDVNVIFCHSDETARGVFNVLKKLGRVYPLDSPEHIVLLGVDGDRFALEHIRKGFFDATSEQLLWKQGEKAVDLVLDALKGKPNHNPVVLTNTVLITRTNVDYVKDHWAYYNLDPDKTYLAGNV